jgi:hypothetical protein
MTGFRRLAVASPIRQAYKSKTFLAPLRGWIQSENLAAASPNGASIFENFFPTTRGMRVRGGSSRHATIPTKCVSLMVWSGGGSGKLFGTNDNNIYNITSPVDPLVAPSADVTGLGSGYFSSTMFSVAGSGDYLVAVNGTDLRRLYDGSAWATTPAITGVTSSTLSHVWAFKNRLFFIQKNTLNAWALPVDTLGGAATQISLSGIFKRGGVLLFGETWSVDAGDGPDDLCVFFTSNGEVAVFSGTDPTNASAWELSGRYDIGKPLGQNCTIRAGGDLIIATVDGAVPLSAVLNKDPAALSLAAVSRNIEDEWRTQAVARGSTIQWSAVKWTSRGIAYVGIPNYSTFETYCYAVNLLTGAWAKYTGWDCRALAEANDIVYFGTAAGKVFLAEATGQDGGLPYYSKYVGLFDHLGNPGAKKFPRMARVTERHSKEVNIQVSFAYDYDTMLDQPPPTAAMHSPGVLWDSAIWDDPASIWDGGSSEIIVSKDWEPVYGEGFAIAPALQVTNSHAAVPDVEIVSIDVLYESGGTAV